MKTKFGFGLLIALQAFSATGAFAGNLPGLIVREDVKVDDVGSDRGSGAYDSVTVVRPRVPEGYYWVGQSASYGVAIVVRPTSNDAVAPPTNFSKVWDDRGSAKYYSYSIWNLVCPKGFSALGSLMRLGVRSQDAPSGDEIKNLVCVNDQLVTAAKASQRPLWTDRGSNARDNGAIWGITAASGSPELVYSNTFVGSSNYYSGPYSGLFQLVKNRVMLEK